MKKSRYTESQIINAIKQYESGRKTDDICREYGISKATFYQWKKKYSGMDSLQLKRLKELEDENRKLFFGGNTAFKPEVTHTGK